MCSGASDCHEVSRVGGHVDCEIYIVECDNRRGWYIATDDTEWSDQDCWPCAQRAAANHCMELIGLR